MNKSKAYQSESYNKVREMQLVFEKDEPFQVNDLVDYLRYLKSIYSLIDYHFDDVYDEVSETASKYNLDDQYAISEDEALNTIKPLINKYKKPLSSLSPNYNRDLKERDMIIQTIKKESPLVIVMTAVPIMLSLAVVLSGGEIELRGPGGFYFKVKVPSLAEGLKKLKDLFKD